MAVVTKVQGKLKDIHEVDKGVYRLYFEVPKRSTRFKAGQFLHLTLENFDPIEGFWPESRVFSIASEPKQEMIEVIYSVKGVYTTRMSIELEVGKDYWLKLPYGDFIVENYIADTNKVVFIAGGTGISPFIPYFHLVLKGQADVPNNLIIFYGVRSPEVIIYDELLEKLQEQEGIEVVLYCESTDAINQFKVKQGRFDIEEMAKDIVDQGTDTCFISGPPVMINLFKEALIKNGFNSNNIVIDEWE